MNRALIVNDNDFITNRTAGLLDASVWEVYTTESDVTAPNACAEWRPDLAIVDIDMRGGTGFEAISAIRRTHPCIFIVAVSRGRHEEMPKKVAEACGADHFVGGPVSTSKLQEAVEKWQLLAGRLTNPS